MQGEREGTQEILEELELMGQEDLKALSVRQGKTDVME